LRCHIHWCYNWITAVHVSDRWCNIGNNVSLSFTLWLCSSQFMVLDVNSIVLIQNFQRINIFEGISRHTKSDPFSFSTSPLTRSVTIVGPILNWIFFLRIIPRSLDCRTYFNLNRFGRIALIL
jgi:hypothetical protein